MNKLTSGSLNYDTYLRIPAGTPPAIVITNGVYYVPAPADYDTVTGRVHVRGAFNNAAGNNSIIVTYGSSDYDADGLLDSYEVTNGLNPLDPTGVNGAAGDPDGDGYTNEQEQAAGTQANSSASALRITKISRSGSANTIFWDCVNTKKYRVQSSDTTPAAAAFSDLSPQINATGSATNYADTTALPGRFYRVRLVP